MGKFSTLLILLALIPSLCFGAPSRDWDGVDDSIATAYTTAFPTPYSISVWVNPDTMGEGNFGRLFSRVDENMWLIKDDTGSTTIESFRFVTDWSTTNGAWDANTLTGFPLDTWSHWVVTYNGSATTNDPTFFKNGASYTTFTESATPAVTYSNSAAQIYIGNNDAASRTWDGSIYFYAVYDHVLTVAEATEVMWKPEYGGGSLLIIPGWESSGNERDLSGGLTGTVTGTTSRTDAPNVMFGGGLPL